MEFVQISIEKPSNTQVLSVWIHRQDQMQRVVDGVDSLAVFSHEVGHAQGDWKMMIPKGNADEVMLSLLMALHDYCAEKKLVPPRTWKEQRGGNSSKIPLPGVVDASQVKRTRNADGTETTTIPLPAGTTKEQAGQIVEQLRSAIKPSLKKLPGAPT